jgi:hypothetical protein
MAKLHSEELRKLYSWLIIIRMIKSRRMRWAVHVVQMYGYEFGPYCNTTPALIWWSCNEFMCISSIVSIDSLCDKACDFQDKHITVSCEAKEAPKGLCSVTGRKRTWEVTPVYITADTGGQKCLIFMAPTYSDIEYPARVSSYDRPALPYYTECPRRKGQYSGKS